MMEYKHLLPFLAVLITFLTINLPIASARRKPTPTVPPVVDDDGSADYDEDVNSPHFDGEDGSGVGEEGSTDDRHPPVYTRMPDFGFGDNTHTRTTTSIYSELEYEAAGDKEENVKMEPVAMLFTHPAVLAAIIIGGILTLLFIVLLVMFIIYRMRKKDEGSYILDDPKVAMIDHQHQQQPSSALIYTKSPSNDQEFFA